MEDQSEAVLGAIDGLIRDADTPRDRTSGAEQPQRDREESPELVFRVPGVGPWQPAVPEAPMAKEEEELSPPRSRDARSSATRRGRHASLGSAGRSHGGHSRCSRSREARRRSVHNASGRGSSRRESRSRGLRGQTPARRSPRDASKRPAREGGGGLRLRSRSPHGTGGDRWRRGESQTQEEQLDSALRNCSSALETCREWGILEHVIKPGGDHAMKLMQWKAEAVLSLRMMALVAHKSSGSSLLPTQGEMAGVAARSVCTASLIELSERLRLTALLRAEMPRGKAQADLAEATLFALHDAAECSGWSCRRKAQDALEAAMDALYAIGRRRSHPRPAAGPWKHELERHRGWLRTFAVADRDEAYSHSSLFGSRDFLTQTGRLFFPDAPDIRDQLDKATVGLFRLSKPLCWVEMSTERYPFYEDIDIMSENRTSPPTRLVGERFWAYRAEILHRMYPSLQEIELTIFVAHGYQKEKECCKASFHAVWNNIIVDRKRAGFVRLATIAHLDGESKRSGGWVSELQQRLLDADQRNAWENVFDQASVKGGSFRMPYCDKVHHGSLEGRPILPEVAYRFTFGEAGGHVRVSSMLREADLSAEEWARRGHVRLQRDPVSGALPPLTPWERPALHLPGVMEVISRKPTGGSGRTWEERQRHRREQAADRWSAEQRGRRRLWHESADDFRKRLDAFMGDPEGLLSTWMEIKAKSGCTRWCWSSRVLKGVVEIEEPSGEVFLRGSTENQVVLHDVLRQFTDPWDGKIPSLKGKTKGKVLSGRKGDGRKGGKGGKAGKAGKSGKSGKQGASCGSKKSWFDGWRGFRRR